MSDTSRLLREALDEVYALMVHQGISTQKHRPTT
jgi:hypothetical protein